MPRSEQSLEDAYFEWLLSQVRSQHGSQTYRELCWELYKKEFIWIVEHDDNRVEDGRDLLVEFMHEQGLVTDDITEGPGCSVLELIISLSRRVAFMAGGNPVDWAWTLMGNLGFHSISDPMSRRDESYIRDTIERLIHRQYKPNGSGGLFPLGFPDCDQRQVELWYQMCAYVEEGTNELHPL